MKNKKTQPFFSIIIPTLNEEIYIPKLLTSLANQSYRNFEIIIVDGQSTDNTLKIIDTFKNKQNNIVVYKSNKKNVSYQRNQGAKESRGNYLIFSDADNQYSKHFFLELSHILNKNPQLFFTTWFKPDQSNIWSILFSFFWNLIVELKNKTKHPLVIGAFVGCKKSAFYQIGKFNENLKYGEDKRFSEDARLAGIKLKIFKKPTFIMCLRRIRKNGIFNSVINYIKLNYRYYHNKKIDYEKDYPMGGNQ